MLVLKFGGTSIGSELTFQNAVSIVVAAAAEHPVVVVSAVAGVTDLLARYVEVPEEREALALEVLERHQQLAHQVDLDPNLLDPLLQAWQRQARADRDKGVLQGAPRDRILSFGERIAAAMFAAALKRAGVEAAPMVAGDCGLVTDREFGATHPLPEAYALLRQNLAHRTAIPVVTGFLGHTPEGEITTLGRGGSDFSAAVLGAAIGAREIQIWTDTSGMLSADPRIVPEARPVPFLSFAEASELAYFGAKVLHPKTLLPAIERGIPVRVCNTQRPQDPGTLITHECETASETWQVKSIACKKGITSITVVSTRMLMAHGFLERVFGVFARHRVVVDLVTTSEVSISLTVDDDNNLSQVVDELETIGRVSVQSERALIAVVGEGAGSRVGLAGHLFTLLGGVGINVEMISQGASNVNLSCVVAARQADQAVRLLHRGLGLEAPHVRPSVPDRSFSHG